MIVVCPQEFSCLYCNFFLLFRILFRVHEEKSINDLEKKGKWNSFVHVEMFVVRKTFLVCSIPRKNNVLWLYCFVLLFFCLSLSLSPPLHLHFFPSFSVLQTHKNRNEAKHDFDRRGWQAAQETTLTDCSILCFNISMGHVTEVEP